VNAGICRPLCVVNDECGSGLVCDRATGACTEEPRLGSPFGAPCDPTDAETCEGLCATFNDDEEGLCTHACPFHAPDGETTWCSYDGVTPTGVCAWPLSSAADSGDAALCAPLCEADADCESEDWHCGPYDSGVASGICLPGSRVSPGARESSDAGSSQPERSSDAGAAMLDPVDAGFDSDAARVDYGEQLVDAALDVIDADQ
jgi:hypothetical protein